jgi:hypothetical protein
MKIADSEVLAAARTSETLVNFYQTTRCCNPEDSNLNIKTDFAKTGCENERWT